MSKQTRDQMSFFDSDNIETAQEIIDADKNNNRKVAFNEAYKKVMQIIPEYFLKKKKKNSGTGDSGGTSFTQNIIVTTQNVKLETNQISEEQVEEDRERED